jgi:hypothetical protein
MRADQVAEEMPCGDRFDDRDVEREADLIRQKVQSPNYDNSESRIIIRRDASEIVFIEESGIDTESILVFSCDLKLVRAFAGSFVVYPLYDRN